MTEFNELFSYLSKFIFIVCESLNYDYHIAGTAVILFRRIYHKFLELKNKDDPRLIAVVCIFITAKAKDMNIKSAQVFLMAITLKHDKNFKYNEKDIIKMEFLCLKIISFDLNVFLPFEPCSDLLMECKRLDILRDCWKLILMTMKTNIYLLYPPYLITMSCIYIVCNMQHTMVDFDIFLKKFHVPYDNIKEVTKIIIQKLYGHNKKQNDKENKNKRKKKEDEIPIRILKQIDLFYQ